MELLREFLRNYENKFYESIRRYSKEYLEEDEELLKLREVFFNQLFKETLHKDFFYNLAFSYAKKGLNLKPVISKVLLELLRDFVDYIITEKEEVTKEELKALKTLFSLIDQIFEIIEKAYSDYLKSVSEHIKKIEELKKKEENFLLKEVELLKHKKTKVLFVFSYKEIPVYCKGRISDLIEDIVEIEFTEKCLIFPLLNVGDSFYMKGEGLTEPVKLEVMQKKEENILARVVGYEEIFIEKREFIRVKPEKPVPVYILEKNAVGDMLDISVGGVGVFLKEKVVEKGEVVTLGFTIKGEEIRVKGECRYVIEYNGGYRAGFKFVELHPRIESLIGQYVMERQLQILKELKEMMV
ncbi:hypothetical protein JCM9492_02910 [Aquifex pyrophilus]